MTGRRLMGRTKHKHHPINPTQTGTLTLRAVGLENELNALRPVALNRFFLQANRRRVELVLPAGAAIAIAHAIAVVRGRAVGPRKPLLPR
jgi:hypothetical protein